MLYDQHLEPVYPDTVKGKCRVHATSHGLNHLMDTTIPYEGYELPDGLIEAWSEQGDGGAVDLMVYPGDVMHPSVAGQVGMVGMQHPDIAAAKDMVQYFYRHRVIAR